MDKRQQKRHEKLLTNSQKLLDVTEPLSRKQLCEILGENYKAKSVSEQEKDWRSYFHFIKKNKKYYIKEVYSEDKVKIKKIEELVENSLNYTTLLLFNFYYNLTKKETLALTDMQLAHLLGLFNNSFFKFKPNPLDKEDYINKAVELENHILNQDSESNENLPYIQKEIKKNRGKQLKQNTTQLVKLYEDYYSAVSNGDLQVMHETEQKINDQISSEVIKNYFNNQGDKESFLPSKEVYKGLIQFYNHVPKNIRTRINRLLKDFKSDYLIDYSEPYAGIKNGNIHILSDSEIIKYLKIVHESANEFWGNKDYTEVQDIGFLMRFKPETFKKFYQERIEKELGYENVFVVNKIVFNHEVASKFEKFYAKKFSQALNEVKLLTLLKKNNKDFSKKEEKNFQNRTTKEETKKPNKPYSSKREGKKTFDYLIDELLKLDWEKYQDYGDNPGMDYSPHAWSDASSKSLQTIKDLELSIANSDEEEIPQKELQQLAYLVNSYLSKHLSEETIAQLLDSDFEF